MKKRRTPSKPKRTADPDSGGSSPASLPDALPDDEVAAIVALLRRDRGAPVLKGSEGARVVRTLDAFKKITENWSHCRWAVHSEGRGMHSDHIDDYVRELHKIESALAGIKLPRVVESLLIDDEAVQVVAAQELVAAVLDKLANQGKAFDDVWKEHGHPLHLLLRDSVGIPLVEPSATDIDVWATDTIGDGFLGVKNTKEEQDKRIADFMRTSRSNIRGLRVKVTMRAVLLDESEGGPLATLAASGKLEAAAVTLDRMGIAPRSTVWRYRRRVRGKKD